MVNLMKILKTIGAVSFVSACLAGLCLFGARVTSVKKERIEIEYKKLEQKYADRNKDGIISDNERKEFYNMYKDMYILGYNRGYEDYVQEHGQNSSNELYQK